MFKLENNPKINYMNKNSESIVALDADKIEKIIEANSDENVIQLEETKEEFMQKATEASNAGNLPDFLKEYTKGGRKIDKSFFFDIDFWEQQGVFVNPNNTDQVSTSPFTADQRKRHQVYRYLRYFNLSLVAAVEEIIAKKSKLSFGEREICKKMLQKKFLQEKSKILNK